MRRLVFTLLACLFFSGLLYGLGLPPFRQSPPVESPRKTASNRALAVQVGEVRRGTIEDHISAVGSLMARRAVSVAPKISGRVERVLVQVGDRIKQGQMIAQLDARELEEEFREAEASLQVAEATLKGKQAELIDLTRKLQRAKRLFEKRFVSRQEMDTLDSERNAAAAQVELARAQIVQQKARLANAKLQLIEAQLQAPFAAYVEKRLVDPGAMVSPGTPIASLVDINPVKVIIPVVEKDYPRISVGQAAGVTFDAYPGERFKGRVVRLAPVLSEETRTGEVEIEVDNDSGRLKPGMFARVELAIGERRDVLLVPAGALVKTPSGHGVYRVDGGQAKLPRVQFVAVEIGSSRDGQTEIRGALDVGDRVVTLGVNLLKDGQKIGIDDSEPNDVRRKGRAA